MPSEQRILDATRLIPTLTDCTDPVCGSALYDLYCDIQRTLRVPFVNFVFRMLANFPDYFLPAWDTLAPRLRSIEFEAAADRLRRVAAAQITAHRFGLADLECADRQAIGEFTDSIHYVLPKLLLVATILDRQLDSPTLSSLVAVERLQAMPGGVADGTRLLSLVDPDRAEPSVVALFEDIRQCHGHPGVASYYRGLANDPGFLAALWSSIRPCIDTPAYRSGKASVLSLADELSLCFVTGRASGDKIADRRPVRSLLAVFRYRFIPDLLMDLSLIQRLLNSPARDGRSRFSLTA